MEAIGHFAELLGIEDMVMLAAGWRLSERCARELYCYEHEVVFRRGISLATRGQLK